MTTTALVRSGSDVVNTETGVVVHDMKSYLSRLGGNSAIQEQQQLSAAYDVACNSLIGPNDVQVEGGRTFKKKSAWRKLARHFGISTSVVSVGKEVFEGVFIATVTVRASAPWGQTAESVGACGTDEATGRRVITIADAIATAETRATNRAVSNLIAMGEVSAEEMSKGAPQRTSTPAQTTSTSAPSGTPPFRTFKMPFGKTKGTLLMDMADDQLSSAIEWAASKDKFVEFQEAAEKELEYRANHSNPPSKVQQEWAPLPSAPLIPDEADIPF